MLKGAYFGAKTKIFEDYPILTNTPYPRKKIRRISTKSSQENTYSQFPIRHIYLLLYAVSKKITIQRYEDIILNWTKSSTKELITPFENPKRVFLSKRRLLETPGHVELSLLEFDLFFDIEEHSEEEETTEVMTETMEQYMSKTRGSYGGSEHEDANEHTKKFFEIVDLFHILEVTQDQIMLRAFPMSLTRAASRWLINEPLGNLTLDKLRNRSRIGINKWYQSFALRNFDLEVMEFKFTQSNTTAKLPILKLENGNSWVSVPQTTQENGTSVTKIYVPVTTKEKTNKKNDVKARSLLLMALPNEHKLTFSQYNDAKTMVVAIET
ncbi:hypothetical protein Tco_0359222 [Tanacetum coccineum]